MSKRINERTTAYINHKSTILLERIYLAIIDKIFDAENYDDFEIDSDNNIYVTYSLKKEETIISDSHDLISDQIKMKYRKKLGEKLEENGYFVEYDDSDIHVYFQEPLKTDKSTVSSIEHNILTYKKKDQPDKIIKGKLIVNSEDSGLFDFGTGEED